MDEMDAGVPDFLKYWFAGFTHGIEAADASAQAEILQACGKACAHSCTVALFRAARQSSTDLETFLAALVQRLPDVQYERTGRHALRVTYRRCGCDLVRLGWVTTPLLCDCSTANLRENLEQSLRIPVTVTRQASILENVDQCVFTVTFEQDPFDQNASGNAAER